MHRHYENLILQHFSEERQMVMLSGPRQVGKTTLARDIDLSGDLTYLNWDDFHDRELLLKGAHAIAQHMHLEVQRAKKTLLILDELHKFPKWKELAKAFFDRYGDQCHILITGSARMDIFKKGGDSLMGRYFNYRLHPLSVAEIAKSGPQMDTELGEVKAINDEDFNALLKWGGFPEPFLKRNTRFFNRWSRLREQQLFREDIRELTRVQEISQLEVMAKLLKAQTGQLTSYSKLANKTRVSVDTIRRWLGILESLYYCFSVRPWSKNISRSLLKGPKFYLWDWSQCSEKGARNENFIASHLLKAVHFWTDIGLGEYGLYYLRDKEKREVDFLVSKNGDPWFIVEVKSSVEASLSKSLGHFAKQIDVKHVFQVAINGDFVDESVFDLERPTIVSARTFLSQLV